MWILTFINFIKYNKIVKLENFNTDFQEVLTYLDLPGSPNDYKWAEHATNASSKLSDYYTPECVALVQEIYAKDFEYFGYDKEPHFALKLDDAQSTENN